MGTGLRNGCRRNEKKLLFSDGSVLPRSPAFGSRMEGTTFERGSRTPDWNEAAAEFELCPLDPCETDPPELCAPELCETDPPELWLLPELPEEPPE